MRAIRREGPILVILSAASQDELNRLYPAFLGDKGRVYVASMAATPGMLAENIQNVEAEVAVVDAELLAPQGEEGILDFLSGALSGLAAVVLLPPAMAGMAGRVRNTDGVHEVMIKPVSYGELINRVYQIGISERTRLSAAAPAQVYLGQSPATSGHVGVAGLRVFAFAATKGGTGKTTLATNFAYRLASQGIRTLLMGFDIPDDVGVQLGLKKAPNSLDWFYRPNPESFKAGLQQKDGLLDVLLSPNDPVEAARIEKRDPNEPGTIVKLVDAARNHRPPYAAIVMDLPPTETQWSIQPLMRATDVVLVLQPSVSDAVKLISTVRLLTGVFSPEYRVPREAIYAVLNGVTEADNLTAGAIQNAVRDELDGFAPPVIATIPHVPQVRVEQNRHVLPVTRIDSFRHGIETMIDFYYRDVLRGLTGNGRKSSSLGGKVLSGLGIKVTLK